MAGHWYDYPVTESYSPPKEYGTDIGTPFHTQITELYGGTVFKADYAPWGGEVGVRVNIPGKGIVNEYYQHLDVLNVSPGQQIRIGDLIGLSGGQLTGGSHPVSRQYSSGPHTEYGFGAPWIGGGSNFNSLQSILDAQSGKTGGSPVINDPCLGCGPLGTPAYTQCHSALAAKVGTPPPCAVIQSPISGLPGVSSLTGLDTFFTGLSSVNWADVGIRVGLILGGGIIVLIALFIMVRNIR